MVREGRVLISVATDPDFGADYSVTAYDVGAQVSGASSGGAVKVCVGHGFAAGDKFIVGTDTTKFKVVDSVTSILLTLSAGTTVSVAKDDLLVNLGQDTGTSTPSFVDTRGEGYPLSIYTDMDYSTVVTNSTVTTDTYGKYRYYHKGIPRWELVRTGTTPIALYTDTGPGDMTGPDASTDNAIVRWDGSNGDTAQNSVVTISDTGATAGITTINVAGTATMAAINASGLVAAAAAVTVGTTLGVTGTSTLAAVNASGLVAAAGAMTVGTTLVVTGTSTLTGGIVGGIPRNVGTWQPPTATPGTYKQPVTTEMYVGSIFVPSNMTVTGIQYLIGTATPTTQKVIAALYNAAGTKVAASVVGGTTMTGTPSIKQQLAFTGGTYAAVGPAWYFIGLMFDTATAALFAAIPPVGDVGSGVVGGTIGSLTAVTPPSSITAPTTFTSSVVPIASIY